jgi:hypothetical protein
VLVGLLAAFPILAIVVYSLRPHTSLLLPRNIEVGAPYALVIFGWLLTRWRVGIAVALSALALGAVFTGTVKMLRAGARRPDGRAAAAFIDAHAPAGTPVLDFPGPQGTQFYFQRSHPVYTPEAFGPSAWDATAREGTPVVMTFLGVGGFIGTRCPSIAPHYRLSVGRRWASIPAPLVACEFVPSG